MIHTILMYKSVDFLTEVTIVSNHFNVQEYTLSEKWCVTLNVNVNVVVNV